MNILAALDDRHIFAPFFKGPSWNAWKSALAALFADDALEHLSGLYGPF